MSNSIINGLNLLNSLSTKPGEGQYILIARRLFQLGSGALEEKAQ
jgi:hypothetical protein